MPTGDSVCPWCGSVNPMQPHFCVYTPALGPYRMPPDSTHPPAAPLTAEDVRRIVREELERDRQIRNEIASIG